MQNVKNSQYVHIISLKLFEVDFLFNFTFCRSIKPNGWNSSFNTQSDLQESIFVTQIFLCQVYENYFPFFCVNFKYSIFYGKYGLHKELLSIIISQQSGLSFQKVQNLILYFLKNIHKQTEDHVYLFHFCLLYCLHFHSPVVDDIVFGQRNILYPTLLSCCVKKVIIYNSANSSN